MVAPMAGQLEFDEGVVAQLEQVYRTRDHQRRRALVREALAPGPGERILDVGCGPGFYVAELAEMVGRDGAVTGVDASEQSLAVAAHRCAGLEHVALKPGDATAIPVEDDAFDAALSVQVLEYVQDVPAALAEIRRALRPGGRVVVWDVDWTTLSLNTDDAERTDRVLRCWDEHLADPALPRRLAPLMREAGFADVRVEGHLFATTELTADTYGGSVIAFITGFTAGRESVGPDVATAFYDEQKALAEAGAFFFSVTQFCFSASRA